MIASLRGTVLTVTSDAAVLEVGGVGMTIRITPVCAAELRPGHEAMLHTALIVREDELSLYGFASREELEIFDLLRGVSGVGPKSALGVLAALSPVEVAQAVAQEDDAPFRRVSGIGPKTAKLIVISLAGKVAAPTTSAPPSTPIAKVESVVSALVGLGWPERVATQAVAEVREGALADEPTAALLRRALAWLGPATSTGVRS